MNKTILCILTLSATSSSCVEEREFPILDLSEALSHALDTNCVDFLLYDGITQKHREMVRDVFRIVSASKMSKAFSIEEYDKIKVVESGLTIFKCNAPLRLMAGRVDTRTAYEKFSRLREPSFTKPVSLVVMKTGIETFFRNVTLPLHLITIAAVLRSNELVDFHEVYRVDDDSPLMINKVGNWTRETGLHLTVTRHHYRGRKFDGKVLRTVSAEIWPFVTFDRVLEGDRKWDGIYPRVWMEVESFLNFSSVHYRNDHYGIKEADGNWTGMVRDIIRHEADVIIADLTLSPDRIHVLDFIYVLPATESRIYYRYSGYTIPWYVVFLPLNYDVWAAVIVWSVALVFCLWVSLRINKSYRMDDQTNLMSYEGHVFFAIRAFVQQGCSTERETFSSRILYLAAYITATVVFVAFSACLISFLRYKTPRRSFDSIEGFLEDGSFKLLLADGTNDYAYFAETENEISKKIFERMVIPLKQVYYQNFTSTGLEMICKNNKLALVETEVLMNSMNPGALGCKILRVDEHLQKTFDGIAVGKSSPYGPFFRFYIHRMREAGLIERMLRYVKTVKAEVKQHVKPISLKKVFIIFLFLFCGMIASVLLLILEIVSASVRRRRANHVSGNNIQMRYCDPF